MHAYYFQDVSRSIQQNSFKGIKQKGQHVQNRNPNPNLEISRAPVKSQAQQGISSFTSSKL